MLKGRKARARVLTIIVLLGVATIPVLAGLRRPLPIAKIESGEVAADSLMSGQDPNWKFFGDVVNQAPRAVGLYSHNESPTGLIMGVRAVAQGNWSGYYAVSPLYKGEVFHARLWIYNRSIPSQYFDTGMWIQTSLPQINTVFCGAVVNSTSYSWVVESTLGNRNIATSFTALYAQAGGPLTKDCTIVTNGENMLRVYFDGVLVYSSDSLDLQIHSPFQTYLEVQSSYGPSMVYGGFSDYFAARNGTVTLVDSPPGHKAVLLDTLGKTIASSKVPRNGTVSFNVEALHQPILGKIQLYDANNTLVTSTPDSGPIWGGSVYTAGPPPPTEASLTVQSMTQSGDSVSGYWVQLWDENGTLIDSGFTPMTFTNLLIGHTYSVAVQDYGSTQFVKWDTGSTDRQRSFQVSGDTTLVAYYTTG
jgi:hypothetical protein